MVNITLLFATGHFVVVKILQVEGGSIFYTMYNFLLYKPFFFFRKLIKLYSSCM
jgi:hypothetical protein